MTVVKMVAVTCIPSRASKKSGKDRPAATQMKRMDAASIEMTNSLPRPYRSDSLPNQGASHGSHSQRAPCTAPEITAEPIRIPPITIVG